MNLILTYIQIKGLNIDTIIYAVQNVTDLLKAQKITNPLILELLPTLLLHVKPFQHITLANNNTSNGKAWRDLIINKLISVKIGNAPLLLALLTAFGEIPQMKNSSIF